jgi:hypothetical protein
MGDKFTRTPTSYTSTSSPHYKSLIWIKDFHQKGPAGLALEQTGSPPRPRPGTAGGVEGCHSGSAGSGGYRHGQLELAGGAVEEATGESQLS